MIGRRGERGSGISVLAARHDDDDDDFMFENDVYYTYVFTFHLYYFAHCPIGFEEFSNRFMKH